MLIKLSDIEILEQNPFQNDALKRFDSADNLTHLIQSVSESFVLSVNSQWGDGKTTFIKMWAQYLKNQGHPCIYFNSWENDFSDDPFVSFVSEIDHYIEKEAFIDRPKKDKVFIKVKKLSKQLTILAVPLIVKYATQGLLDLEAIKKYVEIDGETQKKIEAMISQFAEKKIKEYIEQKKAISSFRDKLENLATEVTNINDNRSPLVIFVDELDRCRPTYALTLLESIKHLFSVPSIFFVLGVDRDQLSHMVRSQYGVGMDADGYLRRFIDLEFVLPEPDKKAFSHYLYNKFHLDEIFKKRKNGSWEKNDVLNVFSELSELFDFSLRTQAQCYTQLNLILRTTPPNYHIHAVFLVFLICLKSANSDLYYKCNNREIKIDDIIGYIKGRKNGENLLNGKIGVAIEGFITTHILKGSELVQYLQQLQPDETKKATGINSKKEAETPKEKRTRELIEYINFIKRDLDWSGGVHEYLYQKIEMTQQFKS